MKAILHSTALAAMALIPATAMAEVGPETYPAYEAWQMEQDELSALEKTDRDKLNGLIEEEYSPDMLTTRMSDASTREIEQALQQRGYEPGDIDGTWDEETTAALEDFQMEHGLDTTGQADENTISALGLENGPLSGRDMTAGDEDTSPWPSYEEDSLSPPQPDYPDYNE